MTGLGRASRGVLAASLALATGALCATAYAAPDAAAEVRPDETTSDASASGSRSAETRERPATEAAAAVLRRIEHIDRTQTSGRYRHRTKIRSWLGLYWWDCSGMAAWILEAAAPRARRALFAERPVAEHFRDTIARAPTRGETRGWQRVARIGDARPGDLFAWRRAPEQRADETGHVGFVVAPPEPVEGADATWSVRIADSTSDPHEDDVRAPDGRTGFGFGTMHFVVDGDGAATAYGWEGAATESWVETSIVFGRVTR